ncbi:MAG: hypothetical protein SVR81_03505 [Chloroflexota bacterium]|nr:hypothetical protein [Thermodesulfobacteriota bacterium]MDY6873021.1 hypothetical protein [Chloroflexota bacterium]
MRCFLWYVQPTGFHKIRHYGFLANGRSRQKIADIKRLLSYENCDTEKGNSKNDSRVTCPRFRKGFLLPFIRIQRHREMFLSKRIRGQCLFDTS